MLWADRPYEGFDTSRDAFVGVYGAPSMPQAVKNGACTGSVAHGWAPVGAMQFTLTLAPGASQTLLLGLGYIENPDDAKWSAPGVINKEKAHAMMERYNSDAAFDRALAALWDHWSRLLDGYQVSSGDEKLDRMVNIWNQYQCMVTFNMSRSASYFESGMGRGMGFRDSCQDLLGFVHMIPQWAREHILDIAATQFPDGSAYHQYQPLTKKGNLAVGSGFNDDPLWLIAGTDAYLRETGDWTILDAPTFGEGKNSWLTGTAAWTFVSISQAILGVQPTLEGLAIDPCIPAEWAGYTVKRRYRGAIYRITVENPHHVEKGIASITVDGTSITGNVLPPAAPGTEVQVRVVMG